MASRLHAAAALGLLFWAACVASAQPACDNTVLGFTGLQSGFSGIPLADPLQLAGCFAADGEAVRSGYTVVTGTSGEVSCCVERGILSNDGLLCNLGCDHQNVVSVDFFAWPDQHACYHRCFDTPADVCVSAPVPSVLPTYDAVGVYPLGVSPGLTPTRTNYVINTTTEGLASAYGLSMVGDVAAPSLYCTRRGVVYFNDGTSKYSCQLNSCGSQISAGYTFVGSTNTPVAGNPCYADCFTPVNCVKLDISGVPLFFFNAPDCLACKTSCYEDESCFYYDFSGNGVAYYNQIVCPTSPSTPPPTAAPTTPEPTTPAPTTPEPTTPAPTTATPSTCLLSNSDSTQIGGTLDATCAACRATCVATSGCAYYALAGAASPTAVSVPCNNCFYYTEAFVELSASVAQDCSTCFDGCGSTRGTLQNPTPASEACLYYTFVGDTLTQTSIWDAAVCGTSQGSDCTFLDANGAHIFDAYTLNCGNCANLCTVDAADGGSCASIAYPGTQGGLDCVPT